MKINGLELKRKFKANQVNSSKEFLFDKEEGKTT